MLGRYYLGLLSIFLQVIYSPVSMDSKALASKIAEFSVKFCNELEKGKSVVSSPLSAEFVLALLALGTTDPSHSELLTSLGLPDDESIRSSFTQVSSKLKTIKGVTLNVANKVYIMDGGYELVQELKDDAVKVFDAEMEKVDFANSAAAAKLINDWVESKTNNKIKELLSADSLDALTRLVLVNAIYFKGNWKKQFNANHTSDQPFYIKKDQSVNVPMMFKEDSYRYGESEFLDAKLLEMPYVGDEASMIVILPNDIEGLDGVLQKLAGGYNLMGEVERMYSTKVQVSIPKFKIETEIDLGELLPKLGIKAIFDRGPNGLTKLLNSDEPLYVSKAVQKAFIEVNEEGAEAAAATAMGITMYCAMIEPEPVPRFVADRPFLVIILVGDTPYFLATHCGSE